MEFKKKSSTFGSLFVSIPGVKKKKPCSQKQETTKMISQGHSKILRWLPASVLLQLEAQRGIGFLGGGAAGKSVAPGQTLSVKAEGGGAGFAGMASRT